MTESVQPCPRCGESADVAGWCGVCGKNLVPEARYPRFSKVSLERERLWKTDPDRALAAWREAHGGSEPELGPKPPAEEPRPAPVPRRPVTPAPAPRPDPYATTGASGERWRYRTTWVRDGDVADQRKIQEHLDAWGAAGWELVSANAVQMLQVKTEFGMPPLPYSTFVMRHYFYWRIPA